MGAKLAKRVLEKYPDHDIDVVVPIPGRPTVREQASLVHLSWAVSTHGTLGTVLNKWMDGNFDCFCDELLRSTLIARCLL